MNPTVKTILTRTALILFGVLLLFTVEVVLRIFWTPPALIEEQLTAVAIDPYSVTDAQAKLRPTYLSAFRDSSFSVPKPAGTFRIFCLGGSTTLGYPYAADVAWPASLERRLRQLFPHRNLEVINLGGTSYGSSRTLALLRGILKYQPDLVIVTTGDAEFVEDSFQVAVRLRKTSVSFLQKLYLSRALKILMPGKQPELAIDAEDQTAAGFLFAPAPTGTVYQVDSARRSTVNTQFRENLSQMLKVAGQNNVPVMLTTLPANVADWPPDFDSSLPSEYVIRLKWRQLVAEGQEQNRLGRTASALANYRKAAEIWSENANFCYSYGKLLRQVGETSKAREMLDKAVALDPTPVRANIAVNQAIRELAEKTSTLMADAVQRLESLVPGGLVGEEMILDYAHPTPRGHAEIAASVLSTLSDLGPQWHIEDVAAESLHQAELARIKGFPPEINADLSFALGQILENKGLTERAEAMYRQAITQGDQRPFARLNLARILAAKGKYVAALEFAQQIFREYPKLTESYGLLGFLYEQTGEHSRAIDWYRRALSSGDRSREIFLTLGRLLLSVRQGVQAQEILKDGLTTFPNDCLLASWHGRAVEAVSDRVADAEKIYRAQLSTDPGCHLAAENLGILLMAQQRWQEAKGTFEQALTQPEPFPRHHLNLGYVQLKGLGDSSAAKKQFDRYQQLVPGDSGVIPTEFRENRIPDEVRP